MKIRGKEINEFDAALLIDRVISGDDLKSAIDDVENASSTTSSEHVSEEELRELEDLIDDVECWLKDN